MHAPIKAYTIISSMLFGYHTSELSPHGFIIQCNFPITNNLSWMVPGIYVCKDFNERRSYQNGQFNIKILLLYSGHPKTCLIV